MLRSCTASVILSRSVFCCDSSVCEVLKHVLAEVVVLIASQNDDIIICVFAAWHLLHLRNFVLIGVVLWTLFKHTAISRSNQLRLEYRVVLRPPDLRYSQLCIRVQHFLKFADVDLVVVRVAVACVVLIHFFGLASECLGPVLPQ